MAMIKCTKCGKMYDNDPKFHDGDITCPHCGKDKANDNIMNGANIFAWTVMSVIVFGMAWFFYYVSSWVGWWIIALIISFVLIPLAVESHENTKTLRATQRDEQDNFII